VKCHPGAEADFASGNIHKTPGKVKKPEVKQTEEPGTSSSGTFLMIGLDCCHNRPDIWFDKNNSQEKISLISEQN
jgi:hypothetical protein